MSSESQSTVPASDAAASSADAELAKTQQLQHSQPSQPQTQSQPQLIDSQRSLQQQPSSVSVLSEADSHPQLVALRKIDALSEKLQKEGKLLEALQCMEKSLILRGHIFGLDSVEVYRACKSVGEMCNYLSMTFLQQDLYDVALELLKKAEVLTERHKAVRAVTLNNLSCYYRKRGKLRTALNYCRKALGIEAKLTENVKSADTHLNMCTILSELKRHEKAIVHARIALKLLLMELFGDFDKLQQEAAEAEEAAAADGPEHEHEAIATGTSAKNTNTASMEQLRARLPPDRVAVLAIAYHNLAVQQEFLRKYHDALISYEKATKVVTTHLGPSHPLVASLSESYAAAQKKLDTELARQRQHAKGGPHSQAKPSKLEQHNAKSVKNLHAQLAKMEDPAVTHANTGFSDGEYDAQEPQEAGFTSS